MALVVKVDKDWVLLHNGIKRVSNPDFGTVIEIAKLGYQPTAAAVDGSLDWDFAEYLEKQLSGKIVERTTTKGGPGSGNFGHAGRPGRVGGSQPNKNGSGIPAVFHGNRQRFEDALEYFGGGHEKGWYTAAKVMTRQLKETYKTDFESHEMREKYFVKPTTPDGDVDWQKYSEAEALQMRKWTLTRAEYTAIRDIFQKRGEERITQLRKEMGLPENVKDLLGEEAFNPELNMYNFQGATKEQKKIMYGMLDKYSEMGKKIISQAGIINYSPDELTNGLIDYYEAQLPEHNAGDDWPTSRKWLNQLHRDIEEAGEFETMHLLSRGDWNFDNVKKEGFRIEGREDDWKPMPDEMWHVTTASDALAEQGLKSRFELGMRMGPGLGGGSDKTASVSTDMKTAKEIERTMQEASMVINGQITTKDLIDLAVEGAGGVGRNWAWEAVKSDTDSRENIRDYDPYDPTEWLHRNRHVDNLLAYERGERVTDYRGDAWNDEKYLDEKWHFYAGNYMWARERVGGFMNPLFFSTDYKKLGKLDPKQFKTHKYIPSNPRANGWQCSSLGEWRVVGSDVLKLKEVIDFYDPDDPDFLKKVLYGG